ncbi:MAG: lipoate--protein ligase family protein [Pirellulaceae bacterium]|nr:lipoate--protein ligase family protein [Pirellulaceae bacterium]
MKLLELTLDTPEANLALDEALLDTADEAHEPREVFRIWESPQPLVVLGRASRVAEEVHQANCFAQGIPILRRCSGGASVVVGPGCLMYAMVLCCRLRPELQQISAAHCFALRTLGDRLRRTVPQIQCQGTSDLTLHGKKFSGNSLRVRRTHILYHGTILYDFPLASVSAWLRSPPRQPEYRQGRRHDEFLVNLPVGRSELRDALVDGMEVDGPLTDWPRQRTEQLAEARYRQPAWNLRF